MIKNHSSVKKRILIALFAGVVVSTIALYANYSIGRDKSEALGKCEFQSLAIAEKLPYFPSDPVDSKRNQRYYDSSAELIMACMKQQGYVQKQPETNNFLLYYKDPNVLSYASYEAATLGNLWVRNWMPSNK